MPDAMDPSLSPLDHLELHWADSELARIHLEADTLRLHFAAMTAHRRVDGQGQVDGPISGHVAGLVLVLQGVDLDAAGSCLDTSAMGRINHGRLLRDGQALPPPVPGRCWQGALRLELDVALHGSLVVQADSAWLDARRIGPLREHLSC